MNDWDKVSLAFDLLDGADVMEQFEEHVWLRVDRDLWEQFCREVYGMEAADCNHTFERDEMMINVCIKCGIEGKQD